MSSKKIESDSKEYKKTVFLIYFFTILILLFIIKTLPQKVNIPTPEKEISLKTEALAENPEDIRSSRPPINEAEMAEEEGKYVDKDVRFSFRYPENAYIEKCEEFDCLKISEYSIRINLLEPPNYTDSMVKNALSEIDLFCYFQSESVQTSCTNLRVENFNNLTDTSGYVLYRVKYTRVDNIEAGEMRNTTQHEKVYLFPVFDDKYGLAVLTTDSPSKINQEVLYEIANTFKNI